MASGDVTSFAKNNNELHNGQLANNNAEIDDSAGFITVGIKRTLAYNNRDPRKLPRHDGSNNFTNLPLQNRFDGLPVESIEVDNEPSPAADKLIKPPPIHLSNVNNYEKLILTLRNQSKEEFKCKGGLDKVVIYPSTPAQYRLFVRYLKDNNAVFHTYQLSEDKLQRVVLKGLHHSTSPESIIKELSELGFKVKGAINIISRFKVPLPMFFIDLEKSENNADIYNLSHLLHSIVRVEELRKTRHTVQCTRCQAFNHSKSYCNHPPCCVKCAGPHFTADCKKDKNTPATCALCHGQHTANYRGCTVYKDLQQKRKYPSSAPTLQKKTSPLTTDTSKNIDLTTSNFPDLRRHHPSTSPATSSTTRFNSHSQQLPASHNNFTHPSYSSAITGDHHPDTGINAITHMMTNFISDIKNLVMPLMSLLTQLTQTLLHKNAC